MDPHESYLRLVNAYGDFLGGLRWSSVEDVIEYDDGETFTLVEEIALFLEGFTNCGPLIHFGFILHLLDLLRGRRTITEEIVRFRPTAQRHQQLVPPEAHAVRQERQARPQQQHSLLAAGGPQRRQPGAGSQVGP